jgi:formate hydrogenlyase subunit 3/multisubunit Na+/H+ antiporter MnhD subunit
MIHLLTACLLTFLVTALGSPFFGRHVRACGIFNGVGSLAAAVLGLIPAIHVLSTGQPLELQAAWRLPIGSFHLRLDLLSAWFCLPVLIISALAAIYGGGYMQHYGARRGVSVNWCFYQLLAGGMLLVLLAWDGALFLIAWELMSIAAWFLVMFEHEKASVQRAGWIYLAATHLGTAFLFAMFVILGNQTGSLDFAGFAGIGAAANLVFIFAIIGFGAKAGFFGLHVWLPEAHPAAPSHVSGLMSGVMIKTGIYGVLRVLTLNGHWSGWWGWLLIGIGVTSGLGGVLYALVQHDLKRMLACCSVENIGIICLGLGIGVLGLNHGNPVAIVAIAGALLHVLNHAIFKTALFMGAGSVMHATGTRNLNVMGGLQKQLPLTSLAFLVSAAAICGLPPLNGFVSEFLIYTAAYKGLTADAAPTLNAVLPAFAVIAALAFIGGLAAICFTKAFGLIFLGEARQTRETLPREAAASMTGPMLALAAACLLIGLSGPQLLRLLGPVSASIHPQGLANSATLPLQQAGASLQSIALGGLALAMLLIFIWRLRAHLLRNRTTVAAPTWGCGYSAGTPRIQYSGSSYVQPLLQAFRSLYRHESHGQATSGHFPEAAQFASHAPDHFMKRLYTPLFAGSASLFAKLRGIQHGRINLYVLYLILTLAAILVWSLT